MCSRGISSRIAQSDEELRAFISRDFSWLLPIFDAYPYDVQRWDAARYALLYKYGGVYADLDLRPVANLSGLLRSLFSPSFGRPCSRARPCACSSSSSVRLG